MQRNGQNPIRKAPQYSFNGNALKNEAGHGPSAGGLMCHKCGTPVPSKPGFRPSMLKCPKCGSTKEYEEVKERNYE